METGEMVTVATILLVGVAILVSIFTLMWQIAQGNRNADKVSDEIKAQGVRLGDEIKAQGVRLSDEIREQGVRISATEREQARLEGANDTLNSILRQQSHTHEDSHADD